MFTLRQRRLRTVVVGTLASIFLVCDGAHAVRPYYNNDRPRQHRHSVSSAYAQVNPGEYPSGSAGWTLAQFLNGWRDQNWKAVACVSRGDSTQPDVDEVRCTFEMHELLGARIDGLRSGAPALTRYAVTVWYRDRISKDVKQAHLVPTVIRQWGRWGVSVASTIREY